MPTPSSGPELPDLPSVRVKEKKPWALQMIWIIPIIAIVVGVNLAYQTIMDRGPTITISFKSGDGLEPGKTLVKYKGIKIGLVQQLSLSQDHQYVIATVQLDKDAKSFSKEGARFWAVRPRVSTSGISGLSTLLSGPYIAAELGTSDSTQAHFVALEVPPILTAGIPGREFILKSPTLGSHDVGTQVYFRRLTVGEVIAYELDPNGKEISIKVFIHAPYDQYVTANTRFWNASGIDMTLGVNGLQVQTESLVSVLIGGIAFETLQHHEDPPTQPDGTTKQVSAEKIQSVAPPSERAKPDSIFPLFQTRSLAMRLPESKPLRFTIDFKQSVKGLNVGAPVEFRGVNVGEVVNVSLAFNPKTFEVVQPVEIFIYPERLQARSMVTGEIIPVPNTTSGQLIRFKSLVDHGLRAQLRSASLLTGKQYVGIDFYPNAPKYNFDISASPQVLQAVPSVLDDFEQSLANLIKNADKLVINTDKLVKKLDREVIPGLNQTLSNVSAVTASDSPLQLDMRNTLRELTKAAGSIKTLTDMLDQQPQSVLFGKPPERSKP